MQMVQSSSGITLIFSVYLRTTSSGFFPLLRCFFLVLRRMPLIPGTGFMSLLLMGGGCSMGLGALVRQTGRPAAHIRIPVIPASAGCTGPDPVRFFTGRAGTPGGMAPLAVPMESRWVPGRFRLFCPLMVKAWWTWADERDGITGERGKLALDTGNCTCSALACPPPTLMLLLLVPDEVDVGDHRDVPAKVLLCRTTVRVPAAPGLPAVPP